MVPVEPISLAIGAVALASLFSTCLECFDYFKAAQSLSSDLEILVNKLDCQKERLLTWGDLIGISKTAEEGRVADLDTPKGELVKRCLNSITFLCSDAEKLQKNYGVQHMTGLSSAVDRDNRLSFNRMTLFRKSFQRISQTDAQRQPNILTATRWAIHDKSKFETLASHIRELVDDLHNVIPVPTRSQETMVHADIACLGLSRLRLVQSACEGIYQSWSDVATAIIMASENGTIDHRNVGEWIQDISYSERVEAERVVTSNSRAAQGAGVGTQSFDISFKSAKLYFVFTPRCLENSYTKCYHSNFGSTSFGQSGTSFLPVPQMRSNHWTLGQRITNTMDVKFGYEESEMLRQGNFELGELQSMALEATLPLGRVYVFTAPCSYSVRTALEVCAKEDSKILRYMVRVDDRMSASCCPEDTKLARLSSIVETMKEAETSHNPGAIANWTKYVDRVWVEQRTYQLEEDLSDQAVSKTPFERAAELFAEVEGENKDAYVFLGEVDHCEWMMQTAPFPWKAKMPKESEIYLLQRPNLVWVRKYIGTFTPRNFKATNSYSSAGNRTGLSPPNPKRQKLSELTAEDASGSQMGEKTSITPTYSSNPEDYNGDNVRLTLSDVLGHQPDQDIMDSMSSS